MSRHTSITTFEELNVMIWCCYLVLMFVYDPVFLGESHPVTIAIAVGCVIGAISMFKYELKLQGWGPNIRMAISTVVVLWTAVEVFSRNGLLTEFWVDPFNHIPEMISILVCFVALVVFMIVKAKSRAKAQQS